jgi:tRNA A-37 threonylcarbamoyl transferase component Bud32
LRGPVPLGRQLLLLERIAVGGMAEVYRAKSFGTHGFERIVAVKRILASMAEDDEFVRMFVDEARLASTLTHQNIVQIFDFGHQDKLHYIAMEYVAGRDLRTVLDRHKKLRQPMDPAMACTIIARVAEALDYAHRKRDPSGKEVKIIHRDVSPQNVLLSFDGEVKLCDFGIAKAVTQSTRTQVGVLKGKFAYMSPEQVRGRQIDRRSDIFALGVIFYEMLTSERLFLGDSDYSTLEAVRGARVTPPRQHNPSLPARLEEVCLKMLAREPGERYQWASEVLEDVTRFLYSTGQVFHAHHLRQYMQDAYAVDIDAENAKLEGFAALKMPPPAEEPKVSSVLEGLGLVGRSVEAPAVVDEPSAPLVAAAAGSRPGATPPAGAARKRPAHDDLSTTVMADEDQPLEGPTRDLVGHSEGVATIAEDTSSELAAEIHAAQAALIERLSALGDSETIDAKDTSGALPPLPRIIDEAAIAELEGGLRTVVEDPAEDDAAKTGETWAPTVERRAGPQVVARGGPSELRKVSSPARPPPAASTPLPSTRPAPSGHTAPPPPPVTGLSALGSRQIKERAREPERDDATPPPRALSGATPPPALGTTPLSAAASEAHLTSPLGAPIVLGPPEPAQPRLLLISAALVVLVTIVFLGVVLWSQQSTSASLLIETKPSLSGAEVVLDGHVIQSNTPVQVDELQLGEHDIEIRAPGFQVYRQTFNISENRPHTLSIPLEPKRPTAEGP